MRRRQNCQREGEFRLAILAVCSSKLLKKNNPENMRGWNTNWLHHSYNRAAHFWGLLGRQEVNVIHPAPQSSFLQYCRWQSACLFILQACLQLERSHTAKTHGQSLPPSHCSTHMWKWFCLMNVCEMSVRKQFTHLDIWLSVRLLQPIRAHGVSTCALIFISVFVSLS